MLLKSRSPFPPALFWWGLAEFAVIVPYNKIYEMLQGILDVFRFLAGW
jgi:hypothetical protein